MSEDPDTVIDIKDLSFAYRKPRVEVFSGFSLSLGAGEVTCLLGHNGAGKSTLLRLVYGLLRGRRPAGVVINKRVVGSHSRIFLLSGDFGFNGELTLRQNLRFRSLLLGAPVEDGLVCRFGLEGQLGVPLKALSSGLLMRANLVSGLAFGPTLVMFDEPTNSIDPMTWELLVRELKLRRERGASAVVVTHDSLVRSRGRRPTGRAAGRSGGRRRA
jgi:ABC-type multidrug transport system ATPase subunit